MELQHHCKTPLSAGLPSMTATDHPPPELDAQGSHLRVDSPGASAPSFKFACNSTIVQHLVPTSSLNKARGGTDVKTEEPHISTSTEATATDGKPHVGRRGMHSATGAYWDEKKDGMWTFKYDGGEGKGMDVVIMLIWVAI